MTFGDSGPAWAKGPAAGRTPPARVQRRRAPSRGRGHRAGHGTCPRGALAAEGSPGTRKEESAVISTRCSAARVLPGRKGWPDGRRLLLGGHGLRAWWRALRRESRQTRGPGPGGGRQQPASWGGAAASSPSSRKVGDPDTALDGQGAPSLPSLSRTKKRLLFLITDVSHTVAGPIVEILMLK